MEEVEREKIRRNFVYLSESLGHLTDLGNFLHEEGLLKVHHLETLNASGKPRNQAHYLLVLIQRCCPSKKCPAPFATFLNSLNQCGFEDVAKKLDDTVVPSSPTKKARKSSSPELTNHEFELELKMKIQKKKVWLMDRLDTEILVEYLVKDSILNMTDLQRITLETTLMGKAKILLDILLEKDIENNPFGCFMNGLKKTEQQFIVNECLAMKVASSTGLYTHNIVHMAKMLSILANIFTSENPYIFYSLQRFICR